MKSLQQHITEWKANSNTVSSIKTQYFIYKLNKRGAIKFFDEHWSEAKRYANNIYMENHEKVPVFDNGWSCKEYNEGTYKIYIKDIDYVHDCCAMFYECNQLISVPLFNTKNITSMTGMFSSCKNLEDVPLLDTYAVEYMTNMFYKCLNLNTETLQRWGKIYDFITHNKIL